MQKSIKMILWSSAIQFALLSSVGAASVPSILVDLYEHYETYTDFVDDVGSLNGALKNIKEGKAPQPQLRGSTWGQVIPEIRKRAEKYSTHKIVYDTFDSVQVQKELNACATYKGAIAKTEDRLAYLKEMQNSLPEIISVLEKSSNQLELSLKSADEISNVYKGLYTSGVPLVREYFTWEVYDIEVILKRDLASLKSNVDLNLKKQRNNLAKMPKALADFDRFFAQTREWIPKVEDYCRRH